MGLLSKTLGGLASKFKDRISQGIQGAKRFAGNAFNTAKQGLIKAKDFIVDNSEVIGGALNAVSPFIGAINPVLGLATQSGASFLQNLKPGPVKDKLTKLANVTVESGAQQAVERKKQELNGKRAKLMTD